MLAPGSSIGNYTVVRHLASGGMGVIYEARHATLTQPVAIKVLASNLVASASLRERFKQEALTQGHLIHPNIVRVTDFVEGDDAAIVMELVRGPSLARLIETIRPVPWAESEVLGMLVPVMEAMAFAHENGVVHRDLKPENILVDLGGTRPVPKISDFGIAKALDVQGVVTQAGTIMGTRPFMSPEQFRGSTDIDARADVFALGMILWFLLAGRLPVDPQNMVQVADLYTGRLKVPEIQNESPVSDAVAGLVMRAIALDADERHPTVRDMLDLVPSLIKTSGEFLASQPMSTLPPLNTPLPSTSTATEIQVPVGPGTGHASPRVTTFESAQPRDRRTATKVGGRRPEPSIPAADAGHRRKILGMPLPMVALAAIVATSVVLAAIGGAVVFSSKGESDKPTLSPSDEVPKASAVPAATSDANLPKKLLPKERKRRFRRGSGPKARQLVQRAEQVLADGDVTQAEQLLTGAIQADPSHVQARLLLASTFGRQGRAREALTGPLFDLYLMDEREARLGLLTIEADKALEPLWGDEIVAEMVDDVAHHEIVNVAEIQPPGCAGWSSKSGVVACSWHCSTQRGPPVEMLVLVAPDNPPRSFSLGADQKASRDRKGLAAARKKAVLALSRERVPPRRMPKWPLAQGKVTQLHGDYVAEWLSGGDFKVSGPDEAIIKLKATEGLGCPLGDSRATASAHALLNLRERSVFIVVTFANYYHGLETEPPEDPEPNETWSRLLVARFP